MAEENAPLPPPGETAAPEEFTPLLQRMLGLSQTVTRAFINQTGTVSMVMSDGSALILAPQTPFDFNGNPLFTAANPASTSDTANPVGPQTHRTALAAADGTTKPAANSGLWLPNPGGKKYARALVETAGSPSTCTIRAYTRHGGSGGRVGTVTQPQTLGGGPNYDLMFDAAVAGGDLLCYVESLGGGISPTVSIYVVWY